MGYLYSEESCSPHSVRFTKEKIPPRFSAPFNEETIFDVLEKLQEGALDHTVFPTIRVVKFGGQLWSLDNRRLWLFQKAAVESVMVREIPLEKSKEFKKFLHKTPLVQLEMLASKQFFPQVDYAWDGLVDIFVKVKKWLRADDIKSDEEEEEEEEASEKEHNNAWEQSSEKSSDYVLDAAEEDPHSVGKELEEDIGEAEEEIKVSDNEENYYPVLWKREGEEDEPVYQG